MNAALQGSLLAPFAGALLVLLVPEKLKARITLVVSLVTAGLALGVVREVMRDGVVHERAGGWGAPLGIDLAADGLSAIHLLMTAVVGLLLSLYAFYYFRSYDDGRKARARSLFWPFWLMLWGSMHALFLSGDLFNLYVVLELIGLAAIGLVILTGSREVLGAGMRYLMVAMAGSMSYLLGVVLLYGMYGTLDLGSLNALAEANPLTRAACVVMTVGLLMKTAVFPLHFWLPPAHASATAPVSALLSALVVKGSFYILLRLWFGVFADVVTPAMGWLLGAMGAGAILWGSYQALRQARLKMLIAHSTVAQLGYLMFLFPIVAGAMDAGGAYQLEAAKGTVYHVLSHALAKASLFLSAGLVMTAAGSDRLRDMRGLAERLPLTIFTMALAGVSLMGLPPSGGFIAKWLIAHAVLGSGQWWWIVFVVGGGLLTAGYMFLMLRSAFLERQDGDPDLPGRVSPAMEYAALALALAGVLIGIRAAGLLDIMMIGNPFGFTGGGL